MKKYFLILPVLFFSFFLMPTHADAFLFNGQTLYPETLITDFNCSNINNEVMFYNNFENEAIQSIACIDNNYLLQDIFGVEPSQNFPDGKVKAIELTDKTQCYPLNYDECLLIAISYSQFNYIKQMPAVATLKDLSGVFITASIDLTKNILLNFWPFILIIGIIAGFIVYILKKLPKRWPN